MSFWSKLRDALQPEVEVRTVTGPSYPSNPASWLVNMFSGGATATGLRVGETNAMSWTPLATGIRFLAESMASLPLHVYRRIERGKEFVESHPITRLVTAPNPEMTWFEFVELMQTHIVLWGNGYAQIVWNALGEPIELWPLNPDRVQLKRTPRGIMYQISLPSDGLGSLGGMVTLPADEVLHIRGFSRWGILGEQIASVHREAIGLGLATEEFAARFFGNGPNASGFLSHPGELSEDARNRLAKSIDAQVGGLSQAHRTLILEEGIEWKQTIVDPQKAQFLELRQFQVTEASRILRIPPHLLYDLNRATFTNIEHQGREVVTYTLLSWVRRWEGRLNKLLISDKMKNTFYTKFSLDAFLRGDTQTRYAAYASARQQGWLSVNDIRELEDMNPVEDGDGYLQPVNMVPLGTEPAPTPAPALPAGGTNDDTKDD